MSSPSGICPRILSVLSNNRRAGSDSRLSSSRQFALLIAASLALTAQAAARRPAAQPADAAGRPRVSFGYGQLPLSFEANLGQTDDRVKFLARGGAIKIGDLLVTSPTPGYAMRSRPMRVGAQSRLHRPGTLLGKALEALPDGKGEILVLLTLQ
jgi:hypothetical protein